METYFSEQIILPLLQTHLFPPASLRKIFPTNLLIREALGFFLHLLP